MNDENSANESSVANLKNFISSMHATPEVSSLLHILLSESPRSCPLAGTVPNRPTFSMDSTVHNFPGSKNPGVRITSTVQALPDEDWSEFRVRSALLLSSFCNAYALPVFLLQALVYAENKGIDLQNVVKVSWVLDKGADRGDIDVTDFLQRHVIVNPEHIDFYLVTGSTITQRVLQQYLDARKVTLTIWVAGELFTHESIEFFSEQHQSRARAIVMISQAMQFFPIYRSILMRRSDDYGMTLAPYNLGVVCGFVRGASVDEQQAPTAEMRGYMFVSGRKAEDITKDTFFLSSNHIYCSMLSLHEINFEKTDIEHPQIPQILPYACAQFQPIECSSPLVLKALRFRNFTFLRVPNDESNCTLLDVGFNTIRSKNCPPSSSNQLSNYLILLVSACEKLIGSNARIMVYVSFRKVVENEDIEVTHVLNLGTAPKFSDSFIYRHSESKSMLCDSALERAIKLKHGISLGTGTPVEQLRVTLRDLFAGEDENLRSQFGVLLKHSKVPQPVDQYLVESKVKVRIIAQECHPQLLSAIAFSKLSPISRDNSASRSGRAHDNSSSSSETSPLPQPAEGQNFVSQFFGPSAGGHADPRAEHSYSKTEAGNGSLVSGYPAPLPESGAIPKRRPSRRSSPKRVSFDAVEAMHMFVTEWEDVPRKLVSVASVKRKSRPGSKKLAADAKQVEERQKPSADASLPPVRPNTLPIPPIASSTESAAANVSKVLVEYISLQKSEALPNRLSGNVETATGEDAERGKSACPPTEAVRNRSSSNAQTVKARGAGIKKSECASTEATKQPETRLKIFDDISASPTMPDTLPASYYSQHPEQASVPRISIEGLIYRSKTSPNRVNYDVGRGAMRQSDGSKSAHPATQAKQEAETKGKISRRAASSQVILNTIQTSSYSTHTKSAVTGSNGIAMKNSPRSGSRVSYLGHSTQGFTMPTTLVVLIVISLMLAAVIPAYIFSVRGLCALTVPVNQCDATVSVFLLTSVILILATTAFCEFYLLKTPTVAVAQVSDDVPVDLDDPNSALLMEVKCEPQPAMERTTR